MSTPHTLADPTTTPQRPWRTLAVAVVLFSVLGYAFLGVGHALAHLVSDGALGNPFTYGEIPATADAQRGVAVLLGSFAVAFFVPLEAIRRYLTGKVANPKSTAIVGYVVFWIPIFLLPIGILSILVAPALQFAAMAAYTKPLQPTE